MQTTDKPISTTQVTRVSDMRTLSKLDNDAILLVVSNGTCWKMPVKKLSDKTLENVLEEVQKVVDDIQKYTISNVSSYTSRIEKTEHDIKVAKLNNDAIQNSLCAKISTCVDSISQLQQHSNTIQNQLSTDYLALNQTISEAKLDVLNKNMSNVLDNLCQMSSILDKRHKNTILSISSNLKNANSISANISKQFSDYILSATNDIKSTSIAINEAEKSNIKKFEQLSSAIAQQKNTIEQQNKQLDDNAKSIEQNNVYTKSISAAINEAEKNNVAQINNISASINEAEKSNIKKFEQLSSVVKQQNKQLDDNAKSIAQNNVYTKSISAAINEAEKNNIKKFEQLSSAVEQQNKQLDDKTKSIEQNISYANMQLSQKLDSYSEKIENFDKKIDDIEVKLFGITLTQKDESGKEQSEVIQQGELSLLLRRINELEDKVEKLIANKKSRKNVKDNVKEEE